MKNNMLITLEQQKIISHPVRSQIILLLFDQSLTSKQVALKLDKTPGNTHYHIQKLYDHGIIELEREEKKKGIIEKYYRAKAINFTTEELSPDNKDLKSQNRAILTLSNDELEEFEEKLRELIIAFGRKSLASKKDRKAYEFRGILSEKKKEE